MHEARSTRHRTLRLSALWREVRHRLAKAKQVAVFSDFDGTLAPIVPHARLARLPAPTRRALRRLARCPRTRVVVVSGRGLADLRRLIRVPGLWYIASHGLETRAPDGRRMLHASAAACRQMHRLTRRLRQRVRHLRGVWVERKPASATIHFRQAGPTAARALARIAHQEWRRANPGLRLQAGKKVFEFLPAGNTSKATAVRQLLERWRQPPGRPMLAFYLGDDAADERVFRRLGRTVVSIAVGHRRTHARYRLASPEAAGRFLARLAEELRCG